MQSSRARPQIAAVLWQIPAILRLDLVDLLVLGGTLLRLHIVHALVGVELFHLLHDAYPCTHQLHWLEGEIHAVFLSRMSFGDITQDVY